MSEESFFVCLMIAVLCAISSLATWSMTTGAWERDSVDNGKAEFYFDEEFNKAWRWKE